MEFEFASETSIRLSIFASVFAVMAAAEAVWPRKARTQPRMDRWFTNIAMVVLDSVAVRIIFPIVAVGLAEYVTARGWGLLNLIALPFWLKVVISAVLLDMAIYWQHVASHKIPMLWKLTRPRSISLASTHLWRSA